MKQATHYIYELPMKVRDYEVDSEGIVNNAIYQHYFEHTRHEFCEQAGLSFRQMHESGIDPVVRRVAIDYLTPLRLGTRFVSRLALRREGARFIFEQGVFHADTGQPAAIGEVTVVSVIGGRPTRGEELAEKFAKYLDD